uniref:Uncharacterized protein n=1 Tax=Siphoviridae sp. ctzXg6 TaxID=2826531 RepID=A0A8S5NDL7_9CAUD|nr:MAG TPA: hypothetical protein [Siphoviridae sp. ctzXg6]DAI16109.1 MAG TPA: hypothetical protein [Caudoviricetes sp.]
MVVVVEASAFAGAFFICYNIHETTIPLHPLWTDTF